MSLLDFLFRRSPTPRKYARLLMKQLALHAPDEPVRFDEAGFRLLVGTSGSHVINLHNLYGEYCAADRRERVLQLERAAGMLRPPGVPSSYAQARPHLMPALRGLGMVEYLRLMELDKDPNVPSGSLFLPFSRDTALMLVHDGERMMQSFGRQQLEEWGVTAEEALQAAMDNLRDATVDQFSRPEPGVFMGEWADAYDSARLLLPDLAHRVAGANPVATVPSCGTLLLASGNDVEGMRAMVALAQRIADTETRPVSALLYRYQDGRPVEYLPEDQATRAALVRLERQYRYGDYAAQKETLDQIHEKNGTDIFIASYKVMRKEDSGEEYSLCSWTEGVDTLLPRADRVALVVPGEGEALREFLVLPWEALYAAWGATMEPLPDAFPERYRARRFPDVETLRPLALD
jgi:hypothetical protein